jgi:transposase
VTPVIPTTGSRLKVNVVSAISNSGTMKYMTYTSNMNGEKFITFMRRLVNSVEEKIFLIVDNLRGHHSRLVKAWLENHSDQIEVYFLPPYSPDLNPDEFLNNVIKKNINGLQQPHNQAELEGLVRKVLTGLQKDKKKMVRLFKNENVGYASCNKQLKAKSLKKVVDNCK